MMMRYQRAQRAPQEPLTRIGICCGCGEGDVLLFKIQGVFRYRCSCCYQKETGQRHWLDPEPKSLIVLP